MRQLIIRALYATLSYWQQDEVLKDLKRPTSDQLLRELSKK